MKFTTRKESSPPRAPRGKSWELLVVDGKPLRKKAQRAYAKAVRDLDAAKAEAERFHNEDQPLYSKWLNSNFGDVLSELREFKAKLIELHNLILEVQEEQHFGNHDSMASAYREVLRKREQAEMADPPDDHSEDPRREFEEAFGKDADELWERLNQDRPERPASKGSEPDRERTNRLKELYRNLVRRLHPDRSAEVTAREKEWWHQTQTAYEAGDVDQLEMILTLVQVEDRGTREASISVLTKLTDEFKKSLRALKRQLTEMRRDAAWNFSGRTDRAALYRVTEVSLRMQRDKLHFLLKHYEAQIERWAQVAPKRRRSRKHTRQTAGTVDEDWF